MNDNNNNNKGCLSLLLQYIATVYFWPVFILFFAVALFYDQTFRTETLIIICLIGAGFLIYGLIVFFNWLDRKKKQK